MDSSACGLYIHVPFCAGKCPYCGFYSVTDTASADAYLAAIFREAAVTKGRAIDTIYIGGGTPSFLGTDRLYPFIQNLLSLVDYSGREFTVEVNPESVTPELCAMLKDLPVSRVSMGVQSFDGDVLKLLGRPHTSKQAMKAVDALKQLDIQLNLDVMYDIPSVDMKTIKDSVNTVISLDPDHISAYSYSPDTGYLTTEQISDPSQTELVTARLEGAGYRRYEISNFAKGGCESAHNIKYWHMEEYLGLGASAHGMTHEKGVRVRYSHEADIVKYIEKPLALNTELYTLEDTVKESVVFGLRQLKGVDLTAISDKFCCPLPNELEKKIEDLIGEGLLTRHRSHLKATPKGLLLLNSVMAYLW